MPLISVRVDGADLAFLRRRRANVSEVVRDSLHGRIEVMRVEEAMARLEKRRAKAALPVVDTIRELRDSR